MNPRKTILLRQLAVVLLSLFLSASVFAESAEDESDDQDKPKAASGQETGAPAKTVHGSVDPSTMTDAQKQAALAKAATDPSAILTQLGFFFWTESSSDNKNIARVTFFNESTRAAQIKRTDCWER
ncbi:MAG: hypothetical protein GQ537_01405 [Gammaproteobacteria bacterium]|nr:hypothetical protein [Gammaproteobacteria bacterium]